ncbi:MAG: ADP-ribosylglycohydrolase family protein [Methanotrichaceae archaeon]
MSVFSMAVGLADRCKGCMLGLAAGDALGMPVEGLTADQIQEWVGTVDEMVAPSSDHFHCNLRPGQFTDDTEQTLLLAESMIEAGYFDVQKFAAKLTDWGRCLIEDPSLNRGVGQTSQMAIQKLLAHTSWKESGQPRPTCGSAMRTAPIGLVYHCSLDLVSRYADLQSLPTHSSRGARAGAVAVATGVTLSILGFSSQRVLEMAASFSRRVDCEFSDRLLVVKELLDLEPSEALKEIGTSPMALETVPAAFYCYLKFEPEEALITAASSGGDTDSIASMAGALIGAANGTSWLPSHWLSCLEDKDRIERVAAELALLSSSICKRTTNPI